MLFDVTGLFGGSSLAERIRLESADDAQTLTLKDGSLVSVICIGGSMRHENADDLAAVANGLRISLAPLLSRPGHAIEFIFSRDPAASCRQLEQVFDLQRRHCRGLQLDLADILDAAQAKLSGVVNGESCLSVIYTRPAVNMTGGLGFDRQTRPEEQLFARVTASSEMHDMAARHVTLTEAICRDLHARGRQADILDVTDSLREIRASLYPFSAPWKDDWMPVLPLHLCVRTNTALPTVMMPSSEAEMSLRSFANFAPPGLDRQLATEDTQVLNARTVRIGDAIFSGFDVTVAPEILTPFDELVSEIMASPSPMSWRCRFLIEPGGLQAIRLKEQIARLFAFAAPVRNVRIRNAVAALREIDGAGDTIIRLRISFATWTRVAEEAELRRRVAILQRAAEQWGNLSTDSLSADPLATVLSTSAGLGPESTAPAAAAPLSAALAMLPISRQASPWAKGSVIFRTEDGKMWPYQPGSSLQNSWAEIYCGTPGSGKSVAMHAINRACLTSPRVGPLMEEKLPLIAAIDIGRSAQGFVDLVHDSLPVHRRHEAMHRKLRMTPEHAINPFDTPLGMRRPLSSGRSFMVNFLAILCSAGEAFGTCPISGLASASLDQVFDTLSDAKNPKGYVRGEAPEVDRALVEAGFAGSGDRCWWEVTDFLFREGFIEAASRAQTFAVPVLSDLVTASCCSHIASLYSDATAETGDEPVIKAFHRRIAEAIRDFCIMAAPTRFDIGPARITALDLEEVAGGNSGPAAQCQTSLMFMLARQAMIGNWLVDKDEITQAIELGNCPPQYQRFHIAQTRLNRQIPKLICIDEFHRTGGQVGFRRQVLQDIREGRKNNVRIALASQLPGDFGNEILDVASTILIFDAPSEASAQKLAQSFGLSETDKDIIRNRLNGPTSDGAPLFAVIRHKKGVARQQLVLTLGANELWALSTVPEDSALRTDLTELLGSRAARSILAARFPGGSAKAEIEARAARRSAMRTHPSVNHMSGHLAQELAAEFRARQPGTGRAS